jgi:hypothetical protein
VGRRPPGQGTRPTPSTIPANAIWYLTGTQAEACGYSASEEGKSFDTNREKLKHRRQIFQGEHTFMEICHGRARCNAGGTNLRQVVCAVAALLAEIAGAQAGSLELAGEFGRLPLLFETGPAEDFVCRGPGYQLWLKPTEAVLNPGRNAEHGVRSAERGARSRSHGVGEASSAAVLRIRLIGANSQSKAAGVEALPTKVNYFIGNDPTQWRTDVPTWGKVRYTGVYPGVDAVYYGNQRQLEFDFVVAPGASPDQIALSFEGAERVEIDRHGDLVLHTADGQLRQKRPLVYQEVAGQRREVVGHYTLREEENSCAVVGFDVAAYDTTRSLVIDPVLVYATYLGGSGLDKGWDIAVDGAGNAYVAGETASTNFPTANGLSITNNGGSADVFVAKISASGTNLVYATYLGGDQEDAAFGVAVDAAGNAYVTGLTSSTNFPVTANAVSTNIHGAARFGFYEYDAFVAKLDASGANLVYSTYLGGTNADQAVAVAVDGSGNVYVTGDTKSSDFPTNNVTSTFGGGSRDAFVVKLTARDTNLVYSRFLGGNGEDRGQGITVDSAGNAIVTGQTGSTDFPTTNALQTNFLGGGFDSFVTKLDASGSNLIFSTYIGGTGSDSALRIASDPGGNIYLAGFTFSTNFPTHNALFATNSGLEDIFVTKLDASGTNFVYSTYLGGNLNDEAWGIAVDTNGNAYVVGLTASANFPTTNALQSTLKGVSDAVVIKLGPAGTLEYSTYLGGDGVEDGYAIAVDNAGNAYVTGLVTSTNFTTFPRTNALQSANGGGTSDAFVAKLFPRNAELQAQRGNGTDVTVFWPRGLPIFELQSNGDLAVTNGWTAVTNAPVVFGNDNALIYTNSTGYQYFRLRRAD